MPEFESVVEGAHSEFDDLLQWVSRIDYTDSPSAHSDHIPDGRGTIMVRSVAFTSALALFAGMCGVGCENNAPAEQSSPTDDEERAEPKQGESKAREEAPPRVPGAPPEQQSSPEGTEARAIDRNCLRRAAGIAGWRDYLRRWSQRRYDVDLPKIEVDRPEPKGPTVVITPTRISADGEELTSRDTSSDAGRSPWPQSELTTAATALADRQERLETRTNSDGATSRRIRVASTRSVRAESIAHLLDELVGASDLAVDFVVRDPSNPPPVDEPRPGDSWVEEMISTFERTSRTETRQQLLDDAIRRTIGRCGELRPIVDRIYLKDRDLADRRSEQSNRQIGVVETVASCPCDEIDWTALEGLLIWSLQPLEPGLGTIRRSYAELPTSEDRSVGAFLEAERE